MVILYDDTCSLCNRFVNFVLKRDKEKIFQFASLESHYGSELIYNFHLFPDKPGTIYLYEEKKVLSQSDAVIKILESLGGVWSYFVILIVLPDSIRNKFYKVIAANRHRIFTRKKRFIYPSEILSERFINEASFSF